MAARSSSKQPLNCHQTEFWMSVLFFHLLFFLSFKKEKKKVGLAWRHQARHLFSLLSKTFWRKGEEKKAETLWEKKKEDNTERKHCSEFGRTLVYLGGILVIIFSQWEDNWNENLFVPFNRFLIFILFFFDFLSPRFSETLQGALPSPPNISAPSISILVSRRTPPTRRWLPCALYAFLIE